MIWFTRTFLTLALTVFGSSALAQDPVSIRFATWDTGEAVDFQQQIVDAFEATHPDIKVQLEAYGEGYDEKMAASFGAGDPPDVAYMWNYPDYAPNLEPLDALVDNDPDAQAQLGSMYQNVLDYNRYQGGLYGLPVGFTTHVVYYNRDLFDAAGVSYPEEGWTWADFRSKAEALTDATAKRFGCALEAAPDPYDWQAYFWSNGGTFISADGTEIDGILNSAENAATLDMMGGLVGDGLCTLGGGNNQLSISDLFAGGQVAMQQDGIWPLAKYQETGLNFGTVGLPAFEGKAAKNVINVSGISIAKDSEHKDAAWEFVKFFTSPEAQRLRLADLPVNPEVAEDFNDENLLEDPLYGTFYQMIDQATETPAFLITPNWTRLSSNIENAISTVMLGRGTGQQALDEAVLTSQRFLR